MEDKNKYPDIFVHEKGLRKEDLQGIKKNELESKALNPINQQAQRSSYGSCWWCSNQHAVLNYTGWYDSNGYYRYYNTCSCQWIPGCGSYGYVRNDYCSHCVPSLYPTMTISQKTNRFGLTTGTGRCSLCGYNYTYNY
jgi:hypothetical protein